jgi:hypothetical protein
VARLLALHGRRGGQAGLIFVALSLRMREILASRHAITPARGAFY